MPTYNFPSQEYVDNKLANKSDTGHKHIMSDISSGTLPISQGGTNATTAANARTQLGITPANIGAAPSSHNHSASNITSGTLPVARGGTGATNAGGILNTIGQGTYTIGVNTALDYASYFEVGRCPITAGGLTQRTTILVNGSWGHGAGILHICLVVDGNTGKLSTYDCEMQMMAKTNKMSSRKFYVDCTSEPGVAILYVYIDVQSWFNFKILHQQSYANYSSDGTDIVNLPHTWKFKVNYGSPANAVRKSSINTTFYC